MYLLSKINLLSFSIHNFLGNSISVNCCVLLLVFNVPKVVQELTTKSFRGLIDYIWVIFLPQANEVDIVFLEPLVLVLPDSTMVFVEVLLVLFHIFLELNGPAWLEMNLVGHLVWNVSHVEKNNDHVRLLPSSMLTGKSHTMAFLTVNVLLRVAILDKFFSLFNECTNVVEL